MTTYTIKPMRCKLVADGAPLRGCPVETVSCEADAVALFRWYYKRESIPHERIVAALLSNNNKLLALVRVSEGGLNGAAMTAADVLRPAIAAGARAVILAHNHPSGDPEPSAQDVDLTRAVQAACEVVGIALLDHVIVGAPDNLGRSAATSLRDMGLVSS